MGKWWWINWVWYRLQRSNKGEKSLLLERKITEMSNDSSSASALSFSIIQLLLAILILYTLEDKISVESLSCHTGFYISHMN